MVRDVELEGIDHSGEDGWWNGSWLDNLDNRSKVAGHFYSVLYSGCGCSAAARKQIQRELSKIQAEASSYMPQPAKE